MATTLTWDDLRALASFRAGNGCAISLYVDLDPSVAATPADVHRRTGALIDEAAKRADAAGRELTRKQSMALRADLDRVRGYVEHELDRDGVHGLALFVASLDNLWRPLRLAYAVPDAVRVNGDLYLTPLVPLVDAGEGTVVAHVGRELGSVYTVSGGRLVQVDDRTEEQPRRHDQGGWSQANYQRHVDNLVHAHLREVAEVVDVELRRRRGRTVVFAGTDAIRSELEPLLTDAVRRSLAGWMRVEAHASAADLETELERVLEERALDRERRMLERWREAPSRAVSGWAETFEAASDGRVEVLLYEAGANREAWRCPACSRIQADEGRCPLDGAELEPHPEGLDLAVRQTLAHGGTAVPVTAHADLDAAGGVAALLRY